MLTPLPPRLRPLTHITPSIYQAGLKCEARAVWTALGDFNEIPTHPAALLGRCFHSIVAWAAQERSSSPDQFGAEARARFDSKASQLYSAAHPLLRAKFIAPASLPFYALFRERAVACTMRIVASGSSTPSNEGRKRAIGKPCRGSERRLVSSDGLLVGQPDYIDAVHSRITDYKTGIVAEGNNVGASDEEVRQLRLYAALCRENGVEISEGRIIRGSGKTISVAITERDAVSEAARAKTMMREINDAIAQGAEFDSFAKPSPSNCAGCSCRSFCSAFWNAATPDWLEICGIQIEGAVTAISNVRIHGVELVTLELSLQHGTVSATTAILQQVPQDWLSLEVADVPRMGDHVRVTDASGKVLGNTLVVRVDRVSTIIWRLPRAGESAAEVTAATEDASNG